MISRFILFSDRLLRPGQQPLRGQGIDLFEQLLVTLDQLGSGPLVTTIFGGQPTQGRPVGGRHHEQTVAPALAPTDDPGFMELALSTATVGFAALAALQVKGPLDHGLGALQMTEGLGEGREGSPELLAKLREIGSQSALLLMA